jgi:hypothetical protein
MYPVGCRECLATWAACASCFCHPLLWKEVYIRAASSSLDYIILITLNKLVPSRERSSCSDTINVDWNTLRALSSALSNFESRWRLPLLSSLRAFRRQSRISQYLVSTQLRIPQVQLTYPTLLPGPIIGSFIL